jgi:hypothetical protein
MKAVYKQMDFGKHTYSGKLAWVVKDEILGKLQKGDRQEPYKSLLVIFKDINSTAHLNHRLISDGIPEIFNGFYKNLKFEKSFFFFLVGLKFELRASHLHISSPF